MLLRFVGLLTTTILEQYQAGHDDMRRDLNGLSDLYSRTADKKR
jgi:hypothetical protein